MDQVLIQVLAFTALASFTITSGGHAETKAADREITVTARSHDYREAPVSVMIDVPRDFAGVALFDGAAQVPVQARMVGGKAEVAFIIRDLKKGARKKYRLAFTRAGQAVPASGVIVEKAEGGNLDIRIDSRLFTRYDTTTGPNKPYFYPIFGPDQKRMARQYPFAKVEGEAQDHPHHRGLWFTHGAVNGADFWSEGQNAGATKHVKYEEVQSGPVYGYFRAVTHWVKKDGTKVGEDRREVKVYNTREGRVMDFDTIMMATDGPLLFGDTKEGSMGIRIPESMRLTPGDGHILMSTGVKDKETWGKKAAWVDYSGTAEGSPMGITIMDHPKNLRHPTTWHVRDYGLFAANPFGLHDFDNDRANPTKGDFTIPAGGSQAFRYRIYFHKGLGEPAALEQAWAAYADPPEVSVK